LDRPENDDTDDDSSSSDSNKPKHNDDNKRRRCTRQKVTKENLFFAFSFFPFVFSVKVLSQTYT
jgi:hypothetical protein